MIRPLIILSGLATVALVAQETAPAPAPVAEANSSDAEIAKKARETMDKLDALLKEADEPSTEAVEPKASDRKSRAPEEKPEKGQAKDDPDDDQGDDSPAGTPLLPPSNGQGRGIDPMSRARLDMMVPTGRSHHGVYFPSFGVVETDRSVIDPVLGGVAAVTAPMESLFESERVTRLDADHVQFDKARWVQFDGTRGPDNKPLPSMKLELERGVYDLKNEILMTNQPVKIENRQFVITANTMLHDRASGLTRLTGNVRMVAYSDEPQQAAEPSAASTEAPSDPSLPAEAASSAPALSPDSAAPSPAPPPKPQP